MGHTIDEETCRVIAEEAGRAVVDSLLASFARLRARPLTETMLEPKLESKVRPLEAAGLLSEMLGSPEVTSNIASGIMSRLNSKKGR